MKILIYKDGNVYLDSAVFFCFTVWEFCGVLMGALRQ
jgi:hypothetical protein